MLDYRALVLLLSALNSLEAAQFNKDSNCTITEFYQVETAIKNCKNIKIGDLKVPARNTLTLSLNQESSLEFQGMITFEYYEWKGPLIVITGKNIHVKGAQGHVINGNGEQYWDGLGSMGIVKPRFIRLGMEDSVIENIYLKNCPVHCVVVKGCNNLTLSGWNIDASDGDKNNFTGHNTDGFDIKSSNVIIKDSIVKNQDDCVAIEQGSNIRVSNLSCYGGHGLSLSVGSSQGDFSSNTAYNITFENSVVHRSPNGIHIKTHCDSGKGMVMNVTYKNIRIEKISNFGINIQQDYSNGEATGIPGTNIPIMDLKLENITGFMESFNGSPTLANNILCGDGSCSNWEFNKINITGAQNKSICTFVPTGYIC